jgi:hypothetical protein
MTARLSSDEEPPMDESKLPAPVQKYFIAAENRDRESLVSCFVDGAVVVDDGRIHLGADAIRRWREDAGGQWTYTTELTYAEPVGQTGFHVVTHLEGDFPGGVADLHHQFLLAEGLVLALTIAV